MSTQDFFTSRRNFEDGSTRIGEVGRLWYDSVTNTIRVGDGVTPGGKIVSSSNGSVVHGGSFYFQSAASDLPGYETLTRTPSVAAQDDESVTITVTDGEYLVDQYITAATDLADFDVPPGDWQFAFWRYVDAPGQTSQIRFRVYLRHADTSETELFSIYSGDINDTVITYQELNWTTTSFFTVNTGDRLLIRVYAVTTSAAPRTIHWVHDNGTASHVDTPVVITGGGGTGYSGYSGYSGSSLVLSGSVASYSMLPPGASAGELWVALDTEHGWVSDGLGGWFDVGLIRGPIGISGYSGSVGISGYSGQQGATGFSGYSGISGYSSYSGYSGLIGLSGRSGYSGISGFSGYSGYSGIQGYSGGQGLSGYSGTQGTSGYSGTPANWQKITGNTNVISKNQYVADTSGGSFWIILPASPVLGDTIALCDGSNFIVNPLYVDRNGQDIDGISDNLVIDVKNILVHFLYDGTQWQIAATAGPKGDSGYSGYSGSQSNYAENTWAPTPTAESGTISSATASGRYTKIGNTYFVYLEVKVTTNGSGAVALLATLPTNASSPGILHGSEVGVSGKALYGNVQSGSNSIRILNYDGTYPAVDGSLLKISGFFI